MATKNYEVIITPTAYREINRIYEYIEFELYAKDATRKLMKKVEEKIQKLKETPKMYPKVKIMSELKRTYRRIIIKNYIILYTIDEKNRKIFVSHMYYSGKNYFENNSL